MADGDHPRFTLVGAGLAGGLLATCLGRAGYEVDLYERRPDPEHGQFVGGRSINLAVSTRGIHALQQIGIADQVLRDAIPMRGRMIHTRDDRLHFQPYDADPQRCIYSIGRAVLNNATIHAAKQLANVRVYFNCKCIDVDLDRPAAAFVDGQTGKSLESHGGIVIGVDGAFSAVRRAMQRLDRFDYSQEYLEHGYKELTIQPGPNGEHRLERNVLHIWPRRSFMMIALPNPDGSFTCTLFWPFDGPGSFASVRGDDDVRALFEREFADTVPLMPTLLDDFRQNPTGSMVTVRCRPWHHAGRVALLGDAAHAVVPFYGQGMNAAFEDCVVLDECVRRFAPNWSAVFDEYEKQRRVNTDALARLAVENFVEMRDKTASWAFRLHKRVDRTLYRLLPGLYTPLYTMVSFTRTPYSEAVRKSRRQDRIVRAVGLVSLIVGATATLGMLFTIVGGVRAVQGVSVAATLVATTLTAILSAREVRRRAKRD